MKWCEGDVFKAPVGQISEPLEIPVLPTHHGSQCASVVYVHGRRNEGARVCV